MQRRKRPLWVTILSAFIVVGLSTGGGWLIDQVVGLMIGLIISVALTILSIHAEFF